MNSPERVLAALERKPLDRIPTDIWATPELWQMLSDHLGPGAEVMEALHIDGFAGIGPEYIGPPRFAAACPP